MRAIDQKGKIFGKLNVIDLIVILLIIQDQVWNRVPLPARTP